MKNLLIVIILFTANALSSAQICSNNFEIGAKASNISGYGIFLGKNINSDYRARLIGLAYYYTSSSNVKEHTIFNYDFGIELHRIIYKEENSDLSFFVGAYYYRDEDKNKENLDKTIVNKNSFNTGIGLSYKYKFGRLSLIFEGGYKYFRDDLITIQNDGPEIPSLQLVTKLAGGIGIGFKI